MSENIDTRDIRAYRVSMEEIKQRPSFILDCLKNGYSTGSPVFDCELMCLQFRKCLELIALSSIASHREEYAKIRSTYWLDWSPKRIFELVEKINPEFYPKPLTSAQPEMLGANSKFESRPDGDWLDRDSYEVVLKTCNDILHAKSPFTSPIEHEAATRLFLDWVTKIVNLLNIHMVQLVDQDMAWVVVMGDSKLEEIHAYLASKVD